MTMFSAENRQLCGGYVGGGYGGGVGSDLLIAGGLSMAEEEEFTTTTTTENFNNNSNNKDGENQSNSKEGERDDNDDDQGWLQLSIGGGGGGGGHSQHHRDPSKNNENESGLVELELMPTSSTTTTTNNNNNNSPEFRTPRPVMNLITPLFYLDGSSSNSTVIASPEINWAAAFRPNWPAISIGAAPSSSTSLVGPGSGPGPYFGLRAPFQVYADMGTGAGLDFRVIQPPPRRPHSGIWFMLQASQNQEREPFLPQISKSYLRIKDGGMTIRLVIKYLVNKLKLDDESEIEIRCKGQRLVPFLTLQHVRDNIWSSPPRDFITLLPNSSTAPHIMVLHYARTTTSN